MMEDVESQSSNAGPWCTGNEDYEAHIPLEPIDANNSQESEENNFRLGYPTYFYVDISRHHKYGDLVPFSDAESSDLDRIRNATPSGSVRLIVLWHDKNLRDHLHLPVNKLEEKFQTSVGKGKVNDFAFACRFAQKQDDIYHWQEHDVVLFKRLLAYQSRDRFCDLEVFSHESEDLTSKASFIWLPNKSGSLVGILALRIWRPQDLYTWIKVHKEELSSSGHDADLRKLGHLVLFDIWKWLTSQSLIGFKIMSMCEDDTIFLVGKDGLPTRGNVVAPVQRLKRKTELLVHALGFEPSMVLEEKFGKVSELADQVQSVRERVDHIERMGAIFQQEIDRFFGQQATRAAISEANSARRLAVLAIIFLPMSLATGILSMQNRLRDIHLVLWDFFGISGDLGILVFTFFWLANVFLDDVFSWWSWAYGDRESHRYLDGTGKSLIQMVLRFTGITEFLWLIMRGKDVYKKKWKTFWMQLTTPLIVALLIALNIGMFGPFEKGWRALEYGVAVGGGFFILGAIILLRIVRKRWRYL